MRLDNHDSFDEILADNKSLGLTSCLKFITAFPRQGHLVNQPRKYLRGV
jgi:hypothetical protein